MEKVKRYQKIIVEFLRASAATNLQGMEDQVLLDYENNQFQLLTVGWNQGKFLHLTLFHLQIKADGKIWILANNTDTRLSDELVSRGVSPSDLVIGFQQFSSTERELATA